MLVLKATPTEKTAQDLKNTFQTKKDQDAAYKKLAKDFEATVKVK